MKICIIPIDNRPVCYNLLNDLASIDSDIELMLPPREYLGDLYKIADVDKLFDWFKTLDDVDKIIISLDTIAYGGLIPSRRSNDNEDVIKERLVRFKNEWVKKQAKVLAFSSVMRISNNNYNEEEKEYWKDYGKKIFEFSYNTHKSVIDGVKPPMSDFPMEILADYKFTRNRNFNINKMYLEWQKFGIFDELVFSKDDCAQFGFNVQEANELCDNGAKVITGADEIPIALFARAIEKELTVCPIFIEDDYKGLISNYEDVSIEHSVLNQLNLAGVKIANEENADLILYVNNFKESQGEIVMKKDTEPFSGSMSFPDRPYMIADVRFANGADNCFIKEILPKLDCDNFYGYSGWNTSANTLGTVICTAKIRFNALKYSDINFKKAQMIRFIDDWAYQANIRQNIDSVQDITEKMLPYEKIISKFLDINLQNNYTFPWNRLFEVEVIDELS